MAICPPAPPAPPSPPFAFPRALKASPPSPPFPPGLEATTPDPADWMEPLSSIGDETVPMSPPWPPGPPGGAVAVKKGPALAVQQPPSPPLPPGAESSSAGTPAGLLVIDEPAF
jgi:hypothetical protein